MGDEVISGIVVADAAMAPLDNQEDTHVVKGETSYEVEVDNLHQPLQQSMDSSSS